MASISRETNGRRSIQFVAADGKRRTIRLGKVPQRIAEEVKVKVEALNAAAISGCPIDNETAAWVNKLGTDLADKLAAVGLISARKVALLGPFLEDYISSRTDHKPATTRNCRAAQSCLVAYFGEDKVMSTITPGDGDEFARHLRRIGLASTTAGRRIKWARTFFKAALRKKLIAENPFTDVKAPAQTNEVRKFFVPRPIVEKVIDACPDAEWRLIVALSRYGGLRCPSETLTLKLEDINWERNRIIVRSPKTAHIPGQEMRIIPLFAELRPFLEEVFELAEDGRVNLINRYHDANNSNLRTQLLRIIKRAGEKPWPRLFHNLRASRQTELMEHFPIHVVCEWLGNSEPIAAKHYLQTTDDHFELAVQCAAESGADALQNPVQQDAASLRTIPKEQLEVFGDCDLVRNDANTCVPSHDIHLLPRGLEPLS